MAPNPHFPSRCVIAFHDDLIYWGVQDLWLESCCQNKYMRRLGLLNTVNVTETHICRKETVEEEIKKEAANLAKEDAEYWSPGCCGRSQQFLWDLFEKPESSLGAQVGTGWSSLSSPKSGNFLRLRPLRGDIHACHGHRDSPQHTGISLQFSFLKSW